MRPFNIRYNIIDMAGVPWTVYAATEGNFWKAGFIFVFGIIASLALDGYGKRKWGWKP